MWRSIAMAFELENGIVQQIKETCIDALRRSVVVATAIVKERRNHCTLHPLGPPRG